MPRITALSKTMGTIISKILHVEDIKRGDIIIAVVGQTGAGKSTFINTAAGKEILPVNHGLKPVTSDVRHVQCSNSERYGDRRVVFVDTPAFDSEPNEQEVEKKLKKWLSKFCSKGVKISGILYLHRISDTRLTDPFGPRLAQLKSLCEASIGGFPSRVMMVTTMWSHMRNPLVGQEREAELQRNWDRLPKGSAPSTVTRFDDSFDDAWSIVLALLGEEIN